jgi:hypothetical protein
MLHKINSLYNVYATTMEMGEKMKPLAKSALTGVLLYSVEAHRLSIHEYYFRIVP